MAYMVKMLWLLYPLHGCLSCSITSGMLCIVGGRESAHNIRSTYNIRCAVVTFEVDYWPFYEVLHVCLKTDKTYN